MTTPRSRQAARLRARRRRAQRRAQRIAVLCLLGALGIVTLVLTAFGSPGSRPAVQVVPGTAVLPAGRPQPQAVATVGNLQIQLPIAQSAVTAIGFHGTTAPAHSLKPLGRQINEGLLARLWHKIAGSPKRGPAWFQLGGAGGVGTEVLDVGAAPGTDVYAPVTGTVAAIVPTIVNGGQHGARIDIRPTSAPSVIVSLTHVEPDPALAVGSAVLATTSKLGTVVDIARVERQALAAHTNDAGDNVAIEVHAAPSTLP
ncbi:MAG TPA: hypothetical protein VFB26_12815 [Gaiellaceae bacterium]|nr:hypothetical protein [Gaiellaceae bacterium]